MKFNAPFRILAAAILCVLVLIGVVVREGLARASGTEAILRMEAVDPRSLLSGHYIIIGLQERIPAGAPCPPGTAGIARGKGDARSRWTALRQNGAHHSVAGSADSRAEAARLGPIVVRGDARCGSSATIDGTIQTEISVDRFYINQADAQRIERVMRAQRPGESRVSAIVSVGRDGRARLKGIIVDGERLELRWI